MDKYIILGHENPDNDSIVSGYLLEKIMKQLGYDAEFIIPDKEVSDENIMLANFVGIDPTKYQKPLPEDPNIKYILVDHHERITPGEIVAIIDHHPTDKDITCKYYQNERACSTSCIIARNFQRRLSLDDIKAACFSAMVDTAAFHSNKTTVSDYNWVQLMTQKFNFNYQEMLTMSMCPTDISNPEIAALNGLKKHNIEGHNVASSFLHLPNPNANTNEINQMIEILRQYIEDNKYDLFAFIVHDITNFKSTLYKISKDQTDITPYDEYTSRGTKIIPDLTEEFKTKQKKKTTNQS